ncbi:syntaxin-11 isoform 3-T20 [Alca torda]
MAGTAPCPAEARPQAASGRRRGAESGTRRRGGRSGLPALGGLSRLQLRRDGPPRPAGPALLCAALNTRTFSLKWSEQGCSCQLGLNHDKRESEVACGSMCRSGMEQKILELFLLSRRIHRICWQQAKPQRWYLWRETLELTKKLPAAIYLLTSTSAHYICSGKNKGVGESSLKTCVSST